MRLKILKGGCFIAVYPAKNSKDASLRNASKGGSFHNQKDTVSGFRIVKIYDKEK